MNEKLAVHPISVPSKSILQSYNCFIVQLGEKTILIDAGVGKVEAWDELNDTLKENDLKLDMLDAILLTHHHIDHIGLIPRILEHVHVPIYAHPHAIVRLCREHDFLTKRMQFLEKLYREHGCKAERIDREKERLQRALDENKHGKISARIEPIREGDELYRLNVIEVPGHSQDHVLFYDAKEKISFVGDFILGHMNVSALIDIDQQNDGMFHALVHYEKSLKKMLNYPVERAYTGHGREITNFSHRIERTLYHIEEKAKRIVSALSDGKKTASQIAEQIHSTSYESQFPFVMSDIIGHLDRLESLGIVKRTAIDGVHFFHK